MKSSLKLKALVGLLLTTHLFATRIYIPTDQATIQDGIDAAGLGDTILVTPGTYYENLVLTCNITVTLASLDILEPGGHYLTTRIDGGGTYRVITTACENTFIYGLTIQNGGLDYPDEGAGLLNGSGNILVENCVFRDNWADQRGGAMYIYGYETSAIIQNCLIYNNDAFSGSAIYTHHSEGVQVENCTVWGNTTNQGGTALGNMGADMIIKNSIVGGSSDNHVYNAVVFNSNIEGGWDGEGGGNIDDDPLFINPDEDNFKLSPYSSSIGGGIEINGLLTDIEGALRPNPSGSNPDMGAYEHEGATPELYIIGQLHVSESGNDIEGDGSLDHPYRSVSHAVNIAWEGDTIMVHPGHYMDNILLQNKNITLTSEYLLNPDEDLISSTIIDGIQLGSVIQVRGSVVDSTTLISGLTLLNGRAEYGGGIDCRGSSPRFKNLIIRDNRCTYGGGGGLLIESSLASITDCVISGNTSLDVGGGIYLKNCDSTFIEDTVIRDNTASLFGGGAFIRSVGDLTIKGSLISDNISQGRSGGGLALRNTKSHFQNCTIINNEAELMGGGIYCYDLSTSLVSNSILWNNTPIAIEYSDNTSYGDNEVSIAFSDIEAGLDGIEPNDKGIVSWLDGNLNLNPMIMLGSQGLLSQDSPCIDAGTNFLEIDSLLVYNFEIWEYSGIAPDMGYVEMGELNNHPPEDFILTLPEDGVLIDSLVTFFNWEFSEDYESENLEYILEINSSIRDTTIDSIMSPPYEFQGSGFYHGGQAYTWYVLATDGIDTTSCVEEFEYQIPPTLSVHGESPTSFKLDAAFPNPFNPSTTIGYTLPVKAHIVIKIFDILGQELTTLQNEEKPAGDYVAQWNGLDQYGKQVSTGVYFCRYTAENYNETIKIVYLR